jgi:hypothetical protein
MGVVENSILLMERERERERERLNSFLHTEIHEAST